MTLDLMVTGQGSRVRDPGSGVTAKGSRMTGQVSRVSGHGQSSVSLVRGQVTGQGHLSESRITGHLSVTLDL